MSDIRIELDTSLIGKEVQLVIGGRTLIVFDIMIEHSAKNNQTMIFYKLGFKGMTEPLDTRFSRSSFTYNGKI